MTAQPSASSGPAGGSCGRRGPRGGPRLHSVGSAAPDGETDPGARAQVLRYLGPSCRGGRHRPRLFGHPSSIAHPRVALRGRVTPECGAGVDRLGPRKRDESGPDAANQPVRQGGGSDNTTRCRGPSRVRNARGCTVQTLVDNDNNASCGRDAGPEGPAAPLSVDALQRVAAAIPACHLLRRLARGLLPWRGHRRGCGLLPPSEQRRPAPRRRGHRRSRGLRSDEPPTRGRRDRGSRRPPGPPSQGTRRSAHPSGNPKPWRPHRHTRCHGRQPRPRPVRAAGLRRVGRESRPCSCPP